MASEPGVLCREWHKCLNFKVARYYPIRSAQNPISHTARAPRLSLGGSLLVLDKGEGTVGFYAIERYFQAFNLKGSDPIDHFLAFHCTAPACLHRGDLGS